MNANELRIGNLVNYQQWRTYKQGVIRTINVGSCNITGIKLISPIDTVKFKMIEPIPLTEDWLLKFGFELKDDVNRGFTKQINFHFMKNFLYVNPKFYTTALWDEVAQKEFFINQVQSIHQLQNVYFALTGTELELA